MKLCALEIEGNPHAEKVITSAKTAINLVVNAKGVHEKHKRHVVDSMLWRITIAPYRHKRQGKQTADDLIEGDKTATRYCSKAALGLLKKGNAQRRAARSCLRKAVDDRRGS